MKGKNGLIGLGLYRTINELLRSKGSDMLDWRGQGWNNVGAAQVKMTCCIAEYCYCCFILGTAEGM